MSIRIIYDGKCPFCSRYVTWHRLRLKFGQPELVDARMNPSVVAELNARGIDLNSGMVVEHCGTTYSGAAAIAYLSRALKEPTSLSRFLGDDVIAHRVYPWLRAGRNFVLRLLLRGPI